MLVLWGRSVRAWYSGGTITFSSVAADDHYLTPGVAAFEDGTVDYLAIPALEQGFSLLEELGYSTIRARVGMLPRFLIGELLGLRHRNGRSLVELYGPASLERRGATVQVNLFRADGGPIDCYEVERRANEARISLRAGCHCNPGAREAALGFTTADLRPCFDGKDSRTYAEFVAGIAGKTTGAVRVSLGLVSNSRDVQRFVSFARTFLDAS